MDGPKALTAKFAKLLGYTVTSVPAGRQVVVDGVTYTTPKVFNWLPGTEHTIGVTSPQLSGTGTRYLYQGWSDQGAQSHTVTAPATATTYTVTFGTQHAVTGWVNPSGAGTLTLSPAAVEVEGGRSWYAVNQAVTATTAPVNASYAFASWTGSPVTPGSGAGAGGAVGTVVMDGPKSVTANFNVAYTVTTVPEGLSVMVDGVTYTTPQTFGWAPGSAHWVYVLSPSQTKAGETGTRYEYQSWSDGQAQFHWLTMPQASTTYTATFGKQYSLTTASNPAVGGSVTPAGVSWWNAGATTTGVTATANPGYQFTGWSGASTSTANPAPGIVMDGPKVLTANFVKALS